MITENEFNLVNLTSRLEPLPARHRAVFAATCCERLVPNYYLFYQVSKWGNPALLRDALNEVWCVLAGADVGEERLSELTGSLTAIIPDTEEFGTSLVSAALDAAAAVVETLYCLVDGSVRRVVDVASFCRDTIYLVVHSQYPDERGDYGEVRRNPRIIHEFAVQASVLDTLERAAVIDEDLLKRLRHDGFNEGVSSMGVAIQCDLPFASSRS